MASHFATGNSSTGAVNWMPALFTRISTRPSCSAADSIRPRTLSAFDMSALLYPVPTPCVRSMSSRIATISAASPNPFSTISAPCAASDLAMPRPMPLVDPVTTATFPFNMIFETFLLSAQALVAVDVVGHAHPRRRPVEPAGIGERAADIFETALPMLAHGFRPELVVLRVPLEGLGLVDEMDDVGRAVTGEVGDLDD